MVKSNPNFSEKDIVRKEILQRLRSQSAFDREKKSDEIKGKLYINSAFNASKSVMFYISKEYEVSTFDMIKEALEQGKRILVPVTSIKTREILPSVIKNIEDDLETGPFGIKQPKSEKIQPESVNNIDIVIVPGIAFDIKGNRIGHGKGYYDKFLNTLLPSTLTIGLAYDFQVLERVPFLSHDVAIKQLISA